MPKNKIILVLGIFIAIVPFLGFPSGFRTFLVIISGLGVSTLSYMIARGNRLSLFKITTKESETKTTEVFVEREPQIEVSEKVEIPANPIEFNG